MTDTFDMNNVVMRVGQRELASVLLAGLTDSDLDLLAAKLAPRVLKIITNGRSLSDAALEDISDYRLMWIGQRIWTVMQKTILQFLYSNPTTGIH